MASRSYRYSFPCSGIVKNSSIWFAALPMHQQSAILNGIEWRFAYFLNRVTLSVLTKVTIGMGDDIHSSNAWARVVSCGFISVYIFLIIVVSALKRVWGHLCFFPVVLFVFRYNQQQEAQDKYHPCTRIVWHKADGEDTINDQHAISQEEKRAQKGVFLCFSTQHMYDAPPNISMAPHIRLK